MSKEAMGLLDGGFAQRSQYHSIEQDEDGAKQSRRRWGDGEEDQELQDVPDSVLAGQLGGKTLGLWSSIVIVTNNVAGPGMLVLPRVFQEAGWVLPTLVLLFICIGSSLVTLFLVDAMARIPGNSNFERRIEFVNVFEHYWGKKGMAIAQTLFLVNMMAQIVSSIVSNAQVMDGFIVFMNPSHTTYALQLRPTVGLVSWSPPKKLLESIEHARIDDSMVLSASGSCHNARVTPFDDGPQSDSRILISAGYISLAIILIPMSLMNLEENITVQKVSFYILVLLSFEFMLQFWVEGLSTHTVPAFGDNYTRVLGSIIFNYAFIVIIPSWINEKKPGVSVQKAVWISTIASTALYLIVGWMGAVAYDRAGGNILTTLSNACSPPITRVSAFLFAFGMIGLGIPFMSIVTRYSLLVGRVCSPAWSQYWAVFFPWMLSWLFYQGGLFNELIAWSGDLAIGPINYVLPLLLVLTSLGVRGLIPSSWSRGMVDAMTPADEEDSSDPANAPTVVEPLPSHLKRFYRPIAAILCKMLMLLIIGSIFTHTRHYVTATTLRHAIHFFETAR